MAMQDIYDFFYDINKGLTRKDSLAVGYRDWTTCCADDFQRGLFEKVTQDNFRKIQGVN
jgi:hypothetical protein